MPFTVGEKLRVQFRKHLRTGHVRNAQLDPELSDALAGPIEDGETFIVKVDCRNEGQLWFSDIRVLLEHEGIHELFRYDSVRRAHWMFKNLWHRIRPEPESVGHLKTGYFDRLEIELEDRTCILDGLGQSYSPILKFFRWILK
jgi:hypothetical protein